MKEALAIALMRAREALLAFYRPMLAQRGVIEPQLPVLRIVNEYAPIGISTLAEFCGLHAPSVPRIPKLLEADGF